jgi:hypothetical protein
MARDDLPRDAGIRSGADADKRDGSDRGVVPDLARHAAFQPPPSVLRGKRQACRIYCLRTSALAAVRSGFTARQALRVGGQGAVARSRIRLVHLYASGRDKDPRHAEEAHGNRDDGERRTRMALV